MKQKLAVARAMFHRPELVFLDEPTAGLDAVAAAGLREELMALAEQEGVTIFLTTHNLSEAEKLCSKVAVIRYGKMLAVGSPEELLAEHSGRRVEIFGSGIGARALEATERCGEVEHATIEEDRLLIHLKPGGRVAPLIPALIAAGVEIEEVRKHTVNLEEAFLALMDDAEEPQD